MPFPSTHPSLEQALSARGYADPTSVQAAVLQAEARGRDLLVSAQTGSGKTVAYGLALADTLLGDAARLGRGAAPQVLVIAPTRELALQVERELAWLYEAAGARLATCVGGMDIRREARVLSEGCHIVVGTPGRLRDHLERGRLDPSQLKAVVLDEADEMLDLGFREDLEAILEAAPETRRTLLFSATIPREIATLAKRYQKNAFRIDTVDKSQSHVDIEYRAVRVAPNEVERAVVNVLRFFEARGAMVFCHTRESVRRLYGTLVERGFDVVALSGELSQNERTNALQSLRDGRARVCVATDVAARGIDLPDLGLVIHAEIPTNADTLLHRSGRTGRAGRKGTCVLIVPHSRRRRAEGLLAEARVDCAWSGPPQADEIRARDEARLLEDPVLAEAPAEEELATARKLLESRSAESIAAALVRLYRARLPAPEEISDGGPPPRESRTTPYEAREPREPLRTRHAAGEGAVWFRLGIGRRDNADPRWLVPIICRRGGVTKADIGSIRIFDRDTRFEISGAAAARFAEAIARGAPGEEPSIEPASAKPGVQERAHRRGPPAGAGRPAMGERPPRLHRENGATTRPARKAK